MSSNKSVAALILFAAISIRLAAQSASLPAGRDTRVFHPGAVGVGALYALKASGFPATGNELIRQLKHNSNAVLRERGKYIHMLATTVKGNAMENTVVSSFRSLQKLPPGYKNLSKYTKYRGNNGLDGLFVKFGKDGEVLDVQVLEVKSGNSQLGMTKSGKQMSNDWIKSALDKSIAKLDPVKDAKEIASLKRVRDTVAKNSVKVHKSVIRANIKNGELVISVKTTGKGGVAKTIKHKVPLSGKTTHGKQVVQDRFFKDLKKELMDTGMSSKDADKAIRDIKKNNKIATKGKWKSKNRLERVIEKSTRSMKKKITLALGTIAKKNPMLVKVAHGVLKVIPYVPIIMEVVQDAKELYDVYALYGDAQIDKRTLITRTAGVAGGLVVGGLAAWGGTLVGAKIGALIGSIIPGGGTAVGAFIGGVVGTVAGIIGYNLGFFAAHSAAMIITEKYFPTLQSDYYFAKLCDDVREKEEMDAKAA